MPAQLNRIKKSVRPGTIFNSIKALIDSSISFSQGDFLVYSAASGVRVITSGDTGVNFLGIAQQTVSKGKLVSPYVTDVDAAVGISDVAGPVYGVEVAVVAKTGDAFAPGCLVYPNVAAGKYHVTSTASGLTAIGVYNGATVASAATGLVINVHLGTTFGGSLQF